MTLRTWAAVAVRIGAAALTLLAVSFVLFVAVEALPGDPAQTVLGIEASAEQREQWRQEWGLDRPLPERYADWLFGIAQGDPGVSMITGQPVAEQIAEPLHYTTVLVAFSFALALVVSLACGIPAGLRPGGRLDRLLSGSAVLIIAVPQFVIAVLLTAVFAINLGWLPAVSLVPLGQTWIDRPDVLVLPVLTLGSFGAAWATRMVRAAVTDADGPNVEAARLAGLSAGRVLRRHLLPRTVPTLAQAFAWLLGGLFAATTVVERVFNYPGLSSMLLSAIRNHDFPMLEAIGLVLSLIVIAALLIADLLGYLFNPRARTAP
ncbi:MAG TPA: ABC transporter permease [Glycomyces sp.]|nr:ABC transporter permease [Glycomyces sp.]